jgi:phosphatidylserine decarboxylase
MSSSPAVDRAEPVPLPANIKSVQPGGGRCYSIELAWGRLRRAWLKTFRRGYVKRMAAKRRGPEGAIPPGAPHEILDPRDLKFCRNVCDVSWDKADDPFRWRERIPFARWGLAELQLMGSQLLAITVGLCFLPWPWSLSALVPGVILALIVYFFRDPPRRVPTDPNLVIAPADGKVVEILHLPHDDFCDCPVVKIGIFLSIFNVHINRAPLASRVIELRYSPGQFLNALNPESAIHNENMWIGLETDDAPHRRYWVRQISGAIARRIVCDLRPGESLPAGHKFGMIKLGSRTELVLPADGLEIAIKLGDKIKAGSTVIARYRA